MLKKSAYRGAKATKEIGRSVKANQCCVQYGEKRIVLTSSKYLFNTLSQEATFERSGDTVEFRPLVMLQFRRRGDAMERRLA